MNKKIIFQTLIIKISTESYKYKEYDMFQKI